MWTDGRTNVMAERASRVGKTRKCGVELQQTKKCNPVVIEKRFMFFAWHHTGTETGIFRCLFPFPLLDNQTTYANQLASHLANVNADDHITQQMHNEQHRSRKTGLQTTIHSDFLSFSDSSSVEGNVAIDFFSSIKAKKKTKRNIYKCFDAHSHT